MKHSVCDDVCSEDRVEGEEEYDVMSEYPFADEDEEDEEECCVKLEPDEEGSPCDKVSTRIKSVDDKNIEDSYYDVSNYRILKLEESNLNGRIYPEKEILTMIGKWYSAGAQPVAIKQSLCEDSFGDIHSGAEDLSKLEQIGIACDFKVVDHWLTCTIRLKKHGKFPYYTLSCLGQSNYLGEIEHMPITRITDLTLVCICNSYTTANVEECATQYRRIRKELWEARSEIGRLNRKIKAQATIERHYKNEIKKLYNEIKAAKKANKLNQRKS